jgi:hypothetical protein
MRETMGGKRRLTYYDKLYALFPDTNTNTMKAKPSTRKLVDSKKASKAQTKNSATPAKARKLNYMDFLYNTFDNKDAKASPKSAKSGDETSVSNPTHGAKSSSPKATKSAKRQ